MKIRPTNTLALWRGFKGKCPQCGQGKLLRAYIKQNDVCSCCDEDYSNIRSDDAPPWLTILIVGHIVGPLALYFVEHDIFNGYMQYVVLLSLTIGLSLLLLPFTKGLFIAAIWLTKTSVTS